MTVGILEHVVSLDKVDIDITRGSLDLGGLGVLTNHPVKHLQILQYALVLGFHEILNADPTGNGSGLTFLGLGVETVLTLTEFLKVAVNLLSRMGTRGERLVIVVRLYTPQTLGRRTLDCLWTGVFLGSLGRHVGGRGYFYLTHFFIINPLLIFDKQEIFGAVFGCCGFASRSVGAEESMLAKRAYFSQLVE
jgi:hypothetical protein